MTDFADWNAPQGHASAIALTGVPLTHLKRSLASVSGQGVNAGTTLVLPGVTTFYTFTAVAYEILLSLQTAAATSTRVQVQLAWSDLASGLVTRRENYFAYAGTAAAPHLVAGRGPTHGDQLQVGITAPDNTITMSAAFLQRSTPFALSLWRTTLAATPPSFPGFASAIADPDGNWLAVRSIAALATGGHDDTLLPLYTGSVLARGQTTGTAAGDGELQFLNQADSSLTPVSQVIYRLRSGQGGSTAPNEYSASLIPLPRAQCVLRLVNNNAASQTLTASVTAQELAAG